MKSRKALPPSLLEKYEDLLHFYEGSLQEVSLEAFQKAKGTPIVDATLTHLPAIIQGIGSVLVHGIKAGYCLWDALEYMDIALKFKASEKGFSFINPKCTSQVVLVREHDEFHNWSVRKKEIAWIALSLNSDCLYDQVAALWTYQPMLDVCYSPVAFTRNDSYRYRFESTLPQLSNLTFQIDLRRGRAFQYLSYYAPRSAQEKDNVTFFTPHSPTQSHVANDSFLDSFNEADGVDEDDEYNDPDLPAPEEEEAAIEPDSNPKRSSFIEPRSDPNYAVLPSTSFSDSQALLSPSSTVGSHTSYSAAISPALDERGVSPASPIVELPPPNTSTKSFRELRQEKRGTIVGDRASLASLPAADRTSLAASFSNPSASDRMSVASLASSDRGSMSFSATGQTKRAPVKTEGYLNKKGGGPLAGYKRRYFKLDGQYFVYCSEKGGTELDRIDLTGAVCQSERGNSTFSLGGPNMKRKFELQAATDMERLAWIRSLTTVIENLKEN